jgi:hypothetical protein
MSLTNTLSLYHKTGSKRKAEPWCWSPQQNKDSEKIQNNERGMKRRGKNKGKMERNRKTRKRKEEEQTEEENIESKNIMG